MSEKVTETGGPARQGDESVVSQALGDVAGLIREEADRILAELASAKGNCGYCNGIVHGLELAEEVAQKYAEAFVAQEDT